MPKTKKEIRKKYVDDLAEELLASLDIYLLDDLSDKEYEEAIDTAKVIIERETITPPRIIKRRNSEKKEKTE